MARDLSFTYRQKLWEIHIDNWLKWSDDKRWASHHYLTAWDKWARAAEKERPPKSWPLWVQSLAFMVIFPFIFYKDAQCEKLYKDFEEKQEVFNKLVQEEVSK